MLETTDNDSRMHANLGSKRFDNCATFQLAQPSRMTGRNEHFSRKLVRFLLAWVIRVNDVDEDFFSVVIEKMSRFVEEGKPKSVVYLAAQIQSDHRFRF